MGLEKVLLKTPLSTRFRHLLGQGLPGLGVKRLLEVHNAYKKEPVRNPTHM